MLTFLYLITFLIVVVFCLRRIIRNKYISLFPIFTITIAVLYLFVPAMIFLFASYDKQNSDLIAIVHNSSTLDRISIYLLVLLCIAAISIPQKVGVSQDIPYRRLRKPVNYDVRRIRHIAYNVCKKWFWGLWLIGFVCTLGMIADIGLEGFIIYSGSARGEGDLQLESGSLFAYASNFSRFLIASLAPGILMYEIKKNKKLGVVLIITFVLSIMLQIFDAGKTGFIIFLIPIFIHWLTRKGLIKIKHLVLFAVALVALVPFLDNIFYFISRGESIENYRDSWNFLNYIMSVVQQFTYPYANMVMREPITEIYGYRLFLDYLAIPVNLIPASLIGGFELDTLYHLTTEYYSSILSSKGGMPNDFLFFSYRQLGVIGILIIGIVTGAIINKLDRTMFSVKGSLDVLNINTAHYFISFCLSGVVFILIEPLSILTAFPMSIFVAIVALHLNYRLRAALK